MEGRWEDAPQALLNNISRLERTLESIHVTMLAEAEHKWHNRLLRKSTIEESIIAFNAELDDATRAFQVSRPTSSISKRGCCCVDITAIKVATLISIHYAVAGESRVVHRDINPSHRFAESSSMSEASDASLELVSSPISIRSTSLDSPRSYSDGYVLVSEPQSLEASISSAVPTACGHRGFRRYHRSEVHLKGRSKIKSGWWSGSNKAQVDGRNVLIKHYDGPAKSWIRDVKILQNLYHPNFPQMIGYSDDETPTPFILLANVQLRLPEALVLDTIQRADLRTCVNMILRFYRDTLDAALYMQRQLNLSDQKLQDYVENASYRIDAENTLVMGLPPPEIDRWVSWRNYGLPHSIRQIYLKILPNSGYAQQPQNPGDQGDLTVQRKVAHLAVLARALLSDLEEPRTLSDRLNLLLGDDEDEELEVDQCLLSLRQIRMAAISANRHDHVWRPNTVPAYKFRVGDLGWIPAGRIFDEMTIICNVLDAKTAALEIKQTAIGWQGSWEGGFRTKQDLEPFLLPNDVHGWPVIVPAGTKQDLQVLHDESFTSLNDAWQFLLEHGKSLADAHKLKAEDLVLVTKAGTDQIFAVHDHRILPFQRFAHPAFGHQRPGFAQSPHLGGGHQVMHHQIHNRPQLPSILYLFSSLREGHVPVWSDSPMYKPGTEPQLIRCTASIGWVHGYVSYIQLHEDDFKE
ncbi:unnamed protein product [Somion occarium]|uniref:Protein kinase domain-containing protein n=1 Tax=Somion occarium TaxID=3059160 RepID=A0ABP1CQM7_9APHY